LLSPHSRLLISHYVVTDFIPSWPKARETIAAAIKEGKFSTEGAETRVPATFEEIPQVWKKLFSGMTSKSPILCGCEADSKWSVGDNQGKLITELK